MSDPLREFRASFFVECEQLLEALQDGLEVLAEGKADAETINTVFRAVHSIKGGAGAFGLDALVSFAHSFETALDELRAGHLGARPDEMRLFFQCGDVLCDLIRGARDDVGIDAGMIEALTANLRAVIGTPAEGPEGGAPDFRPVAIDTDFALDAPADPADPAATRACRAEMLEIFPFADGLRALDLTMPVTDGIPAASGAHMTQEAGPAPRPSTSAGLRHPAAAAPNASVRVDLDLIDRLVNLVGELVVKQAMLSQSVAGAGLPTGSTVSAGLDHILQLTRDIQDSVMMIHAQPVKSLFQRMARIVRESAADVGKSVRLRTEGETTEIDRIAIERLADPLTHMIRNAVDHGLESPDARVAAGKPPEGRIVLSAAHRSGRVVIDVSDDGAGIDRPRVRRIAEERGLIAPGIALTDAEVDGLLFLPGFTTASAISNLSGRGVGLDVVRTAIAALGGRISIASETGRGTTFTISLPLTHAMLDGMVVRVAEETLVIPLNTIVETLALAAGDVRPAGHGAAVVQVRGVLVPLFDLGAELGLRARRQEYAGSIAVLVEQEDGSRAAAVVDAIEDQRQVVIKGLQDSYGPNAGVAAATILCDGKIALILDPSDLIPTASHRNGDTRAIEGTG